MHWKNTLCPYLVEPLASGFETDREHIMPLALGAPESFVVGAARAENNRLNNLVDAPMLNDQMIRFLSTIAGIQSRSGPVTSAMEGVTDRGDEFVLNVSSDQAVPRFKSPVIKASDGAIIGVKGFGDQVHEAAATFKKKMANKGREVSFFAASHADELAPLNASISTDFFKIFTGITKIAYLTTVWAFGDHAINSESGRRFRAAIGAGPGKSTDLGQISFEPVAPHLPAFFPLLGTHQHLVFTIIREHAIVTYVKIFGGIGARYATPRDGIALPDGEGETTVINATTRKLEPFVLRTEQSSSPKSGI